MVLTDEMIRRQSEDRKKWEEINRLMFCRATYPVEGCPNGVDFAECQKEELKPCTSCPVYEAWERVRQGYIEQGLESSEATWLTHQFYDIPTAYMCNGKIMESEKKYFPARYEQALKRQEELLEGKIKKSLPAVREEKPEPTACEPEQKQMSIFDYFYQ